MHGNYRHHYLLSPATSAAATTTAASSPQPAAAPTAAQFSMANSVPTPLQSKSISRQQQQPHYQHQQHAIQAPNCNNNCSNYNGLPPMAANGNGIGVTGLARMTQSKQISPTNYQLQFSKQQQQQRQQQVAEQSSASQVDRLIDSQQRFSNGRLSIDKQQQQQQQQQQQPRQQVHRQQQQQQTMVGRDPGVRLEYCSADMAADMANHNQRLRQQQTHPSNRINSNNNNNNQILASKQCEFFRYEDEHEDGQLDEGAPNDVHRNQRLQHQHQHHRQTNQQQLQDHYASQIRNSQLQYRFQQQQQQQQQQQNNTGSSCSGQLAMQRQPLRGHQPQAANQSASSSQYAGSSLPASQSSGQASSINQSEGSRKERPQAATKDAMHVNFNRSSQTLGADDDEGDTRKKKYLTAKYGQQQMNLIKKRLKIEMWLYERLQELAKGSGAEAELDEIDLDLDELLDMEDDDTRRRWLKKTLEPFESLPAERIDKFIDEVLEQSKLL